MPETVLHPTGIKNNEFVYDMPQVPFRFHDLASSVPKMIVDVGKSYVTLPTGIPKDVIKEVQYYTPIPPKQDIVNDNQKSERDKRKRRKYNQKRKRL